VRLKLLAAHLSLTVGTASRAINNDADISPKTRARVKRAAEGLGYRPNRYRPNQTARRLSLGGSEVMD
jgi:LacI family transcriptional regulator